MCQKNISCLSGCSCTNDVGLLFLRIAIGIPFIAHGLMKLMDIPGTVQFFGTLGLSPSFSYIVGGAELLAGIMILFGIWAFIGGWVIAITMICAYALLKSTMPFLGGFELDFAFLFGGLAIALLGSGKYSLVRNSSGYTTSSSAAAPINVIKSAHLPNCACDGKGGCSDGVCTTCPGCNPNLR